MKQAIQNYGVSLKGFKFPSGYKIGDIREELRLGQKYVVFKFADGETTRGFQLKASNMGGIRGRTLYGNKRDDFFVVIDAWVE